MKRRAVKRDDSSPDTKGRRAASPGKEGTRSCRWLKKGLLAAVAVYILVPVTYKIIPALLQDIIYTYRLSVPFFVDLSRPADLSLNHTINMYLTSGGRDFPGCMAYIFLKVNGKKLRGRT
ncbi:hypothetical protein CRENBAI_017485 [Crenichthys baileyi]|uniref:Uncharacterized protein n=1 Tax=Crenichthys baileyi TaxID=28760 RepID=A0AAV9QUN4_9TELE